MHPPADRLRRQMGPIGSGLAVALAVGLYCKNPAAVRAENTVRYKWEDYSEEKGRIQVRSQYLQVDRDLNLSTTLSIRGLIDAISGASPTGQPPPEGSDQVPLSKLTDRRKAVIAEAAHQSGRENVRLQFAYSSESDYWSRGYAATSTTDFNDKNTTLQIGYSFDDDDVATPVFGGTRRKRSHEVVVGVTQLLNPDTYLTAAFTYGVSQGYLADPYKLVAKNTELAPGIFIPLTFPENRPGRKEKWTALIEYVHFVKRLNGSADTLYRFYHDDQGVQSHTLELAWLQKFGRRWVVSPSVRYYRQSAADYYFPLLDQTSVQPVPNPTGQAPFYSSDYRLSSFAAYTYGFKAVYSINDSVHLDLAYDRYDMRGRDGRTAASAYPTANITTIGIQLWY